MLFFFFGASTCITNQRGNRYFDFTNFFRPNMSKLNKKSRSDPRSRGSRVAGGRGANNTNNQSQTRNNRQQRPERSGNLF